VSQLADRFVKDPHEVVKTGQVVKVTVTEVDVARKRIGLTMRKDGGASAREERNARGTPQGGGGRGGNAAGNRSRSKPQHGGKSSGGGKPGAAQSSGAGGTGALGAALMDAFKKR